MVQRRRDSLTIFIRSQVDAEFGEGLRSARRALRAFTQGYERDLARVQNNLKDTRLELQRLGSLRRERSLAGADKDELEAIDRRRVDLEKRRNDLAEEEVQLKRTGSLERARLTQEVALQERAAAARDEELRSIIERRNARLQERREERQARREASRQATRDRIAARRAALDERQEGYRRRQARRQEAREAGFQRRRDRAAAHTAANEAARQARRDALSRVLAQEAARREGLPDSDPFVRRSRVQQRIRRLRRRGGGGGGGTDALRGEAGSDAVLGAGLRAQGYRSVRQFEQVSGFPIPGLENLFLATTAGPLALAVAGTGAFGVGAAVGGAALRNSVGDYRRLRASANAANVRVDELARVAHIARLAGVEQAPEDFAKDIIKDTREFIGEALRESERGSVSNPRVEVLRELGINAERLRSLSRIDQVALLQERLAGLDNERQQFLVSEFFGGSDERFNVFLAVGAERLREFSEEARHAAFTNRESNARFERHILTLDRFGANLDRVSERIATSLLPSIANVVGFLSYHLDTPTGQASQRRREIRDLYRSYSAARGATGTVGDFAGINALAYGDPAIVRRQAQNVEQRRLAYRTAIYRQALELGLIPGGDSPTAQALGVGVVAGQLARAGTYDYDADIQRLEREASGITINQVFTGPADPGTVYDAADQGARAGILADTEDFS